nr:cilia- and flagella-associated protein 251-like [Symphalangus syndactylus]
MSTSEKRDLAQHSQSGGCERAALDPGFIRSALVPQEWVAEAEAEVAPEDFQEAIEAVLEEEEDEAWVPIDNWFFQLVEEEEEEEDYEREEEGYEGEEEDCEEEEEDEDKEEDEEEAEDEDKEEKEKDSKEDAEIACGACSAEHRVWDTATEDKLEYLFQESLPMSVLFFSKEAAEYKYENSDEEAQEAGGKKEREEDENEELEGGLEKDLDSAEDSPFKKSSLEAEK